MTSVLGVWDYQPASDRFAWSALNDTRIAPLATDARFLEAVRSTARGIDQAPCEQHQLDDGSPRWIGVFGGAQGSDESHVLGVAIDMSEQRRRQEEAELLVAEMDHRLRNMITVVQAIAGRTLLTAESLPQARAVLNARLTTMAENQPWRPVESGHGADLEALLGRTLAAFGREDQIRLRGPRVAINAKAALGLSLVLHELVTNAIKHGALRSEEGRIEISWRMADETQTAVRFAWRERGGPRVAPSGRIGFGTRMIARALGHDGAPPRLHFAPAGIRVEIDRLALHTPPTGALEFSRQGAP